MFEVRRPEIASGDLRVESSLYRVAAHVCAP